MYKNEYGYFQYDIYENVKDEGTRFLIQLNSWETAEKGELDITRDEVPKDV